MLPLTLTGLFKKSINFLFISFIVSLISLAIFLLWVNFRDAPKYPVPNLVLNIQKTKLRIAEGKKLALMSCVKCHFDEKTNALSGAIAANPEDIGDFNTSNITQDSLTGIGAWTDGQLAYFLRTGVSPDGLYHFYMPKYPLLSDEDLFSIITFLKSNDSLVRPVTKRVPKNNAFLLVKTLVFLLHKPYKYPNHMIPPPDTNNAVELGRYLATRKFSCYTCHSGDMMGNYHADNPENSRNFFLGGAPDVNSNHETVVAANLTFDKETGIGNWSERDFVRALKFGIKPNGKTLRDPMFPFYVLSDREAKSIYAYLKTLKPIKRKSE